MNDELCETREQRYLENTVESLSSLNCLSICIFASFLVTHLAP